MNVACDLMFTINVQKYLLGEVILIIAYFINHLLSWLFNFETPLSLLIKKYPNLSTYNNLPLKTFGCTTFVYIYGIHWSKLDPWDIKTIFIGYSPTQKGYCN